MWQLLSRGKCAGTQQAWSRTHWLWQAVAHWRSGIMSKAQRLRQAVAHQHVGGVASCPKWVEIFASLFENTKLFLTFVIDHTAAAADCGASARQPRGIMSEVHRLWKAVAHWHVGGAAWCPSSVDIFPSLFENTKLFLAFVINSFLIDDISNSQFLILHASWIYLTYVYVSWLV